MQPAVLKAKVNTQNEMLPAGVRLLQKQEVHESVPGEASGTIMAAMVTDGIST